jgi:hypothetical protein
VGHCEWSLVHTGDPAVFAIRYENEGDLVFAYHNVSDEDRIAKPPDMSRPGFLYDVFADSDYDRLDANTSELGIGGYGYRWLLGREDTDRSSRGEGRNEGRDIDRKVVAALERRFPIPSIRFKGGLVHFRSRMVARRRGLSGVSAVLRRWGR